MSKTNFKNNQQHPSSQHSLVSRYTRLLKAIRYPMASYDLFVKNNFNYINIYKYVHCILNIRQYIFIGNLLEYVHNNNLYSRHIYKYSFVIKDSN